MIGERLVRAEQTQAGGAAPQKLRLNLHATEQDLCVRVRNAKVLAQRQQATVQSVSSLRALFLAHAATEQQSLRSGFQFVRLDSCLPRHLCGIGNISSTHLLFFFFFSFSFSFRTNTNHREGGFH